MYTKRGDIRYFAEIRVNKIIFYQIRSQFPWLVVPVTNGIFAENDKLNIVIFCTKSLGREVDL